MSSLTLPTISLTAPVDEIVSQLSAACRSTGFFYITDYNISNELLDSIYKQSQQFFALPYNTKRESLFNSFYRGYSPMYDLDKKCGDRKEGYYYGTHIPEDHPLYNKCKFYGSNQFVRTDVLPDFNDTVKQYHTAINAIAHQLTPLIFQSLGCSEVNNPYMNTGTFDEDFNALRLIRYPAVSAQQPTITLPDGTIDTIYGNGAHTDSGFVTILSTDTNTGLQLQTVDGMWHSIEYRPNTLIVNIGDMLNIWSNGVYKSTKHRVIRPPGAPDRYSMPFFFNPQYDCNVSPLQICCRDHAAQFPATTCGKHIENEFAKGLLRVTPELQSITGGTAIKCDTVMRSDNTAASKYSNQLLYNESMSCGESLKQISGDSCGESYHKLTDSNTRGDSYRQLQECSTSCGEAYAQHMSNTCGDSYGPISESSCGETYARYTNDNSCGEAYNKFIENNNPCGDAYEQHVCTTCGDSYSRISENSCGESYQQFTDNGSCGDAYTKFTDHSCGDAYQTTETPSSNSVKLNHVTV